MPVEDRRKALIQENLARQWGDVVRARSHTGAGKSTFENLSYPSPSPSSRPRPPQERQAEATPVVDYPREDNQCSNSDSGNDAISLFPTDATSSPLSGGALTMTSTQGWSLDALLGHSSNFIAARRLSATSPDLEETINDFESRGEPLVVEGYHNHPGWPREKFTLEYFVQNAVSDEIGVRNVHDWTDSKINIIDFVERCRSAGPYATLDEKVRLYGKDMECPKTWERWLQDDGVIPSSLIENGTQDFFRYRPKSAAVQTLMCYFGIGDTFTPCHKDLCASSGQNLMCYTEEGGSSFWFMTEGSSSADAARYFHSLGRELDHENHVVTLEELAKAPFKVYIIDQKLGDLVLVPPRSCHQVVNFGGITIKTSWSRMTLEGLSTAYYHELPIYRRVCRPEIYRVKSTIHHALVTQTKELRIFNDQKKGFRLTSTRIIFPKEFNVKDLKALLSLYDCILAEEYSPRHGEMHHIMTQANISDDEDLLTCDYCGGDIFQSLFDCCKCTEDGNHLHICPGCFVEGRRCKCEYMRAIQYRDFNQLVETRDQTECAIRQYEEQRGRTFRQELALKNASVPPLFRAACYLNKIFKKFKWSCVPNSQHDCVPDGALYCKQCHGSRCFSYIKNRWHVHPSEALMAHASDETHTAYHKIHLQGRKKFEEEKRALEQSQRRGIRHHGYSLLLYNALSYVQCNPHNSRFLTRGWYDRGYEALENQTEKDITNKLSNLDGASSSGGGPTQGPIVQLRQSNTLGNEVANEMIKPSKKRSSFYVDVPRAPYPIQRALTACSRQSSSNFDAAASPVAVPSGESRVAYCGRRPAVERSTRASRPVCGPSTTISQGLEGGALGRPSGPSVDAHTPGKRQTKTTVLSSLRFKKMVDKASHGTSSDPSTEYPQRDHRSTVSGNSDGGPTPAGPQSSSTSQTSLDLPTKSEEYTGIPSAPQAAFHREGVDIGAWIGAQVGILVQNAGAHLSHVLQGVFRHQASHPSSSMTIPTRNEVGVGSSQASHATSNYFCQPVENSRWHGEQDPGFWSTPKRKHGQVLWNDGPSMSAKYPANGPRRIDHDPRGNGYRPPSSPSVKRRFHSNVHNRNRNRDSYVDETPLGHQYSVKRHRSDEQSHDVAQGRNPSMDERQQQSTSSHRGPSPRSGWKPAPWHPTDESLSRRETRSRYRTGRHPWTPRHSHSSPWRGSRPYSVEYTKEYNHSHQDVPRNANNTTAMRRVPNNVASRQGDRAAHPFHQERDSSNMAIVRESRSQSPASSRIPIETSVHPREATRVGSEAESRDDKIEVTMEFADGNPRSELGEHRPRNGAHTSEAKSVVEAQHWEDGYGQTDEEESAAQAVPFRFDVLPRKDENAMCIDFEDELERNPWID